MDRGRDRVWKIESTKNELDQETRLLARVFFLLFSGSASTNSPEGRKGNGTKRNEPKTRLGARLVLICLL